MLQPYSFVPYLPDAEKYVERIVSDEHAEINHMVLPQGDAMLLHNTNANVYMVVLHGSVTLTLNDEAPVSYPAGTLLNIPYNTKMLAENTHPEVLEFFVIKAPHPRTYASAT